MQHTWIPSTLGHGETMCSRCFVTNREAAAIGMLVCDAPAPKPANENKPWTQEQIDAEMIDDDECSTCGGIGVIEGDCTCMDDTCCCLEPTPPDCPECSAYAKRRKSAC